MFGLTFLFPAALWALPLAGLPVVLHLLFRRKSPVVMFSTIRFIKASVQQTAARKRVQKWMLLALRVFLLMLLIAAVAQPAREHARGAWSTPGKTAIAAIVVDTSYSMMLSEHHETLLDRADAAVKELLNGPLASAKVAVFTSPVPSGGQPERLRDAAELSGQWTSLVLAGPQANPRPLVDRVASAVGLLAGEKADDKWLVVISDFQKREFPNPLPDARGMHVVLIDLHPQDPHSAGVVGVKIDPDPPTAGAASEAVVDLIGPPDESRAVAVSVQTTAGDELAAAPSQVAKFDSAGHARLRVRLPRLPAQRWMLLRAAVAGDDDMEWDNARQTLIEMPPRQIVTYLGAKPTPGAIGFATWEALDPYEGMRPDGWPLNVRASNDISGDAQVAVLLAEDWPGDAMTARLMSFVRGGGTLILCLRPGLEETWLKLPDARRAMLTAMLPSEPAPSVTVAPINTVSIAAPGDRLFAGIDNAKFKEITVRRVVPFSSDPQGTLLLSCFPFDPMPGLFPTGLLFRRGVGNGTVYTLATLPALPDTNLQIYSPFLPLMVRMSQRPAERSDAQNIDLGGDLTLLGRRDQSPASVTIRSPAADQTVVPRTRNLADPEDPGHYTLGPAPATGVYAWLQNGTNDPLALTNVQPSPKESELYYAPVETLVNPDDSNVMIARSVGELKNKVADMGKPRPQWALPISMVLLLLCIEALAASLNKLWKPISLRGFLPTFAAPAGPGK